MSLENFKDYNANLESKNNKENKQESKSEKKERLIIFWLKQKWITYRWLKLKIKELKQIEKNLKDFPEDEEMKQKIERLRKEINSKAVIIKVKENDNLRNLCKNYYGKWSVSTMILIPKLWYKDKIRIWENLPLPLKKHILPLIKKGMPEDEPDDNQKIGDWGINEDWKDKNVTGNPEILETESNQNNTSENLLQTKIKETSEQVEKENWLDSIENISSDEIVNDKLNIEKAKETFENWKIYAVQQWLLIYANYLTNYANNLEFVKITFRSKLQKNFLQASQSIKKQIQNIKTEQDLDKLYEENLKYFKNNLLLDNNLNWNWRIINQFKSIINACKKWLENKLVINNQENIPKQEIRKQINNIKWEIFDTIRKIDETDDGIFIKDSWNYEANFHTQTLNYLLTETNLIKPKQLSDIAKIDNFDYDKLLKDFLNKKEIKDNQTETEILQNNYYLLEIQNNLSKLNISEEFKEKLLEESNNFFKEHFESWYKKELKKFAKQRYNDLFLENINITSQVWQNTLNKYWYTQDVITWKIKKNQLNKLFYKEKPLKEVLEEIWEKLKQYKLPKFENVYKQTIKDYQNVTIQQYKLFLKEKLTNYYLNNIDNNELIKQAKEDKLVDLYTKIHGLGEYKVSDETETKVKFRWKELAIQTVMLIPAVRIWNIPAKVIFWWMERTAKVKLADYALSTFTFTQIYNIEDIARKDNVKDKETFQDKYYKSVLDRKTLWKNFILLGWMKYLQEAKIVENVEQLTMEKVAKIGQKYEKNYNTLGNFLWKVNWTAIESVSAISLMEWWTIIFDKKNISKEDMIFAIAMVLSLKANWKWEEKIIQKLKELKINHKLKAVYIPEERQEKLKRNKIKKENINKMEEKLKEEERLIVLIEDFGKRFQEKPWKEIKSKRYVKNKIDEFVNKSLWIKWEKLVQEDKNIKDRLVKLTEKILEDKYQKYLEEGGNNNYGGEIVDAKLSKAVEYEKKNNKEFDLINKMIKSVEWQKENILSKKAIKWVEKFLNKYVWSEQFYKDYPQAKDLPRLDKAKQVKQILNEYIEIWELIEDLRNKWLSKTERLSKFIKWLNKIDKGMVELIKKGMEEKWSDNKPEI